jgi:hypothetical protein
MFISFIKKINSFIPIPHPFPSLLFPSPLRPQSYFEMVRLCSLSYSEFFYFFPCFFVHYSVIYHCFAPATIIGPFPFFVPLSVPAQYLPSSFSYSSIEVPSQEYTIFPDFFHCVFDTPSSCLHLFTVYCHYFPPFIAYMNFSFHASFFFSLFLSFFFNPQFHLCYYSPGSSSLFLFIFCPLTFPFR